MPTETKINKFLQTHCWKSHRSCSRLGEDKAQFQEGTRGRLTLTPLQLLLGRASVSPSGRPLRAGVGGTDRSSPPSAGPASRSDAVGSGTRKRTGERRDERLGAAPTRSGTCPLAVGSLARRAAADPESCEFLGAPPRRYGVKNGGATLEPGRRRGGAGCS